MSELGVTERLLILEHDMRQLQTYQRESEQTFTQINDTLRPSLLKVMAAVFPFILAVGIPIATFLVQLGKYPDAEQFVKAQAEYRATQDTTEKRMQSLEVSRAEQEVRLTTIIESLRRLEGKLDTALARPTRQR